MDPSEVCGRGFSTCLMPLVSDKKKELLRRMFQEARDRNDIHERLRIFKKYCLNDSGRLSYHIDNQRVCRGCLIDEIGIAKRELTHWGKGVTVPLTRLRITTRPSFNSNLRHVLDSIPRRTFHGKQTHLNIQARDWVGLCEYLLEHHRIKVQPRFLENFVTKEKLDIRFLPQKQSHSNFKSTKLFPATPRSNMPIIKNPLNQFLVEELKKLNEMRSRHDVDISQITASVMNHPNVINSSEDAAKLMGLSPKTAVLIDKILGVNSGDSTTERLHFTSVGDWLDSLGLDNLLAEFSEAGYDTMMAIEQLDDADINVICPDVDNNTRRLMLSAAKRLRSDVQQERANIHSRPHREAVKINRL